MNRPKNDTLLRALRCEPHERTPIWLMRQAGRYLPEYRATRQRAGDFLTLCKTPSLACEVTLQPLSRFDLDAAILFSDILTIPDAMGLGLSFQEGEGPRFARPLRDEAAIRALHVPDPTTELRYVLDAVGEIRRALAGAVPLIGFAGSPFTLACYMVEGGASDDFRRIKTLLYQRPDLLHHILDVTTQAVIACLNAQIEAGVEVVQVFDTWGGVLSTAAYREFSLAYLARIVSGLRAGTDGKPVPSILFTRGGGLWLEDMAATGCTALGLDWGVELGAARQRVGNKVALQGNLDPMALFAGAEAVAREATRVLDSYHAPDKLSARNGQQHWGHVFNLGHGISQFTPAENVASLVEAVHNYRLPE